MFNGSSLIVIIGKLKRVTSKIYNNVILKKQKKTEELPVDMCLTIRGRQSGNSFQEEKDVHPSTTADIKVVKAALHNSGQLPSLNRNMENKHKLLEVDKHHSLYFIRH